MRPEQIARVCHEVNRWFCFSMGDASIPVWEAAPDWMKQSCISGVLAHMKNPQLSPEESHALWREARNADGWKWGPVKSYEKKEHPNMVPFVDLPMEQKAKDYIFRAVVHAILTTR